MLGATTLAVAPLWGCGGGGGDSVPPVSSQQGPTAVSQDGAQFTALPQSHALEVTRAGTARRFGGVGTAAGQFNYPADVAVLGDKVYVVETGNHRVQVFDSQGNSLGTIGDGILNYPGGITTTSTEILVSDSRNGRIVAFDPQGRMTRVLGEGVLSAPRGLADTAEGLLVADPGLRKVLRLGSDGTKLGELGQWVLPYDVASDGNQLYVADASASEIAVVSASGQRVSSIVLDRAPSYLSFRSGSLYVV